MQDVSTPVMGALEVCSSHKVVNEQLQTLLCVQGEHEVRLHHCLDVS
jgi:hypothetical protein